MTPVGFTTMRSVLLLLLLHGGSSLAATSNFAIQKSCGQEGDEPIGPDGKKLSERLERGSPEYNYQCYTPTDTVKDYAPDAPAPANLFAMESEATDWVMDIAISSLAPIIIGILGFIIFLVWSCATLRCCAGKDAESGCCFGKCCGEPFLWSKMVKRIVALVGFAFGFAVFVIALRGSTANKTMNDAIDSLVGSFENLETWGQNGVDSMDAQKKAYTTFKASADDFVDKVDAGDYYKSQFSPDCAGAAGIQASTEASSQYGEPCNDGWHTNVEVVHHVGYALDELREDLSDMTTSIADIPIAESMSNVNDTRNTLVLGIWVCLALFTVFTMANIALSQLAPQCMVNKPAKLGFGCLTLITVVLLLLLFVFAGGLKILTVTMAGFCVDPDSLMVAEIAEGEPFGYYLTCDTKSSPVAMEDTIPYKKDTDKVMQSLYVATDQIGKLVAQMKKDHDDSAAGTASDYTAFYQDAVDTHAAMEEYMEAVGGAGGDQLSTTTSTIVEDIERCKPMPGKTGPGGWADKTKCQFGSEAASGQGFTSGAFSSISCYEANARYQSFANALCDDFLTSVAVTYELLLAAGICMIFMELARRLVRAPQDWKSDTALPHNAVSPAPY